jgi:hypothetical protein
MTDTRQADLNYLREAHKVASPFVKKMIEQSANKIRKESQDVKSMREALIREHRQGNQGNIKDIHEIVAKKAKYQNY